MTVIEWFGSGWALAYAAAVTFVLIVLQVPKWRLRYWQRRNKLERARVARLIEQIREQEDRHGRQGERDG